MADIRLQDVVFYSLESASKAYRRFAQCRLDAAGIDITIDQWLVLKTIHETADVTLQQVGVAVFKDFASITRIVQLLERKGLLRRKPHSTDRRRSELVLTKSGQSVIRTVEPVAQAYRRQALDGIDPAEVARLRAVLKRITENCDAQQWRRRLSGYFRSSLIFCGPWGPCCSRMAPITFPWASSWNSKKGPRG